MVTYRDTRLTIPEIGESLDADIVMEGSVSRTGDSLTVTAHLIATDPERHLWTQRYQRNVSDVFDLTREIARSAASEMRLALEPGEAGPRRSVIPAAYDAYLLGRYSLAQRTRSGFETAQKQFEKAIAIDPEFALPYVGLAEVLGSAAALGMRRPSDSYPQARRFAQKAIELDGRLGYAHMALAAVHFYWDWDWAAAEAEAHRAISLDPDDAESHRLIAHVLSRTGRYREAIAEVERGRELDPLAPLSLFEPVFIYYLSHEYQTAVDLALDALAAQPDFWRGHWLLCLSLSALGRHDEAIEACNTAVAASRRAPPALAALGYEYALDGRQAAASQLVEELEARRDRAYVGPACIAVIQKALQLLEQARNDRDQLLVHAHGFRFFDPIRSTPRFSAFTRP